MMAFASDLTASSQRKILSQRSKKPDDLDLLLESQGLYRKRMPRDGNSLFRSISDQLLGSQKYYLEVRRAILTYCTDNPTEIEHLMSRNNYPEMSLAEYLIEKCLSVLQAVYRVNLKVFREPAVDKINCYFMTDCASKSTLDQVILSVDSELHWDSVYSHETMRTMAFCQGMMYNMLYQDVFQLKNVSYAVNKMLDKSTKISLQSLRDRRGQEAVMRMANGDYSEYDQETDMQMLVDQGIPPFPFKVAKSLDFNIYRNIEFDIWESSKVARGASGDECVLQVGSKCLVRTKENIKFVGYVQQLEEDKGVALVYVEQIGKIQEYPLSMLQPMVPFQSRKKFRPSRRYQALERWHQSSSKSDAVEMMTQMQYCDNPVEEDEEDMPLTLESATVEEAAQLHECEDSYSADESDVASNPDENIHCISPAEPPFQQPSTAPVDTQQPFYTEPLYYAYPGYYPAYFPYTYSPVDMSVTLSYSVDGSDLPVNDVQTLRYFFNQGVQYVRSLRNNAFSSAAGALVGPTPGGQGAPTPGYHVAPTPGGQGAPTPGYHVAPTPGGQGAPTPGYHVAPTPGGQGAPMPGYHVAPTPGCQVAPTPGYHVAPTPGGQGAPTPGYHVGPTPGGQGAPTSGYHVGPTPGGQGAPTSGYHVGPTPGGHVVPTTGYHVPPNLGGHVPPTSMDNVLGHGAIPVQATMIPPGTPMTPGTPTEAAFFCPQFYTQQQQQQQYQPDGPTFVQEGELIDGSQYFIPQYYVTTPATPPACHTAYVPQWPLFTP